MQCWQPITRKLRGWTKCFPEIASKCSFHLIVFPTKTGWCLISSKTVPRFCEPRICSFKSTALFCIRNPSILRFYHFISSFVPQRSTRRGFRVSKTKMSQELNFQPFCVQRLPKLPFHYLFLLDSNFKRNFRNGTQPIFGSQSNACNFPHSQKLPSAIGCSFWVRSVPELTFGA